MSEITRILTNLTMAYGLMSKDQFVDAITNYAHTRDMNEDKVKELIEQVFDELELTNKRRKANQAYEAAEKEIIQSKIDLEKRFKIPINHFCYPYGNFNNSIINVYLIGK